ncbi:Unannotated [Lentimonas sp. CC4]|nr:Unannotated [Lentimonas sp. CC4]CAA6686959.1 Unannotated [Lentimonas sp. CC6]CAA7077679.1 Unannotated [Lentimonas sp. CC4]CAA7168489.1 Unannotated [Lentimonas sp. CC21]CAA7182949.1 Unannotated [Lentimonas sp. CC8]
MFKDALDLTYLQMPMASVEEGAFGARWSTGAARPVIRKEPRSAPWTDFFRKELVTYPYG